MGEGQERQSTGGLAWRFALHTAVLYVAMAAPFFLFDIATAAPVAVGAALTVTALWLVVLFVRDRGKPKQPVKKINLLYAVYVWSVPAAAFGLLLLPIFEWEMWAYRPVTTGMWDELMIRLIVIAGIFIYPPILFLLLAPRLARKGGGDASRFLKGIRARGFGLFKISWLSLTATVAGWLCLFGVLGEAAALQKMERWRDSDGVVTIWELVAAYPYLPLALLATAAMMVPGSIFIADNQETEDAMLQAYIDGAAEEARAGPGTRAVLTAVVAGCCAAALLSVIYSMHLSMTAKGVRDGRAALDGVIDAIAILENTHEDDDRTNVEFAAEMNRFGFWSPDAPAAGLGSLVADPAKAFPETCTVRIAAGTIDPPAASDAEPELKYCIALACAPPFTWSTPPALLLVTSHDSQAEGWRETWYPDVFAEGRAAAPGGYCTADGELTEEFQG